MNKKERIQYLDLLKCLGMFIVVQGHIHSNYGWFSLPLHCFVIPLYFFLSGLTFRRSKFPNFIDFVKHRFKSLLVPYVMFSVVTWGIWALYNLVLNVEVNYWAPLLQTILAQGSGGFLVHNVPLWFVPCLFVIEMLYYWLDKLHNQGAILFVLVLCAIFGGWMIEGPYASFFHLLPWSIEGAFVGIVFYGVGNLLVKNISLKQIDIKVNSHKRISFISIVVISVIVVFTSYWNGHVSIGSDLLGKSVVLFFVNAFAGIISISLFSILVCSIDIKFSWYNKIMNFHYWFGRNSFYIMSTHVPIKGILIVMMASFIGKTSMFVVNDYVCCAIIFTLTCIFSSLASILVVKKKEQDEKWMLNFRKNKGE